MHNPKNAGSFFSGCWNTGTNPDMTFASKDLSSSVLRKHALEKFSWSQHQPLLIAASKNFFPVSNKPYKRWNFREANWELYGLITTSYLSTYYFLNLALLMIHTRTSVISSLQENKLSNSRNRKNNYRTCLGAEYKHLYQVYQRAPQGKATSSSASALLSHLDEK